MAPKQTRGLYARRKRRRGGAVIEVAFMMPWLAFLFVGTLDFGFYSYAAISVENAARVAALYETASGIVPPDQPSACFYVLHELQRLSNVAPIVASSTCSASPVRVTAQTVLGSTLVPPVGGSVTKVTVTYSGIAMVPLPRLMGSYRITRSAWMEQ